MVSRSSTSGSFDLELVLALLDLAVEHGVGTDEQGDAQQDDDARSCIMPVEAERVPDDTTNQTTGMTSATVITRMARKRSTASAMPLPAQMNFWRTLST